MSTQLLAKDLCLVRGDRCLFRDLDFALGRGELLLIEGANGSGKTSLLRAIAGLLDLESGSLTWNGSDTLQNRQGFHSDLVWLAHRTGLKSDLTLTDNLQFETGLRCSSTRDWKEVLERLRLTRLADLPLRSLSAGQQRRVALARLLLADAPLWLMDEPFTNLDSAGEAVVIEIVTEHLQRGGLCLMASHRALEIEAPIQRVRLQ